MKHKKKSKLFSQHGFTQWIILIILMLGIGVGVWVAQIRTNLVPQASVQAPQVQSTAVSLKLLDQVKLNIPFNIEVLIRSDIDPVRLVTTHLSFDPATVEIIKINTPRIATDSGVIYATASSEQQEEPKVTEWLETLFDNKTGKAVITGLFGNGNLKTEIGKEPFSFVTITMKSKSNVLTEIKIDDTSLLLRAADNANILTKTDGLKIEQATPSAATK